VVAVFQTDLAGFARRHGAGVAQGVIWRWTAGIHRLADITLAPSSASAWALGSHGVEGVRIWARGVDLERFSPTHRSASVRHELAPGGEVIVGYVGRLAREKQVHRLRPVAAMDGVKLVVVGEGSERRSLERAMPAARFLGLRTGDDLGELYASFDVFAHTGLDETFCQTVQEALASGIGVVAPAVGGPLDLVRHRENGLLWSPDMTGSLVGAVGELAQSPVLRQRLGHAARASVLHRPWSAVTDELVEHYESVARPGRRLERVA
jgi:phosphatidylinositol alpha 1,6-mannosyltransferase